MRVTKTIRAYIEKEVKARVMPKYEAEKAEAERQQKMKNDFVEACADAAKTAYEEYFNAHFGEIADFCEARLDDFIPSCYSSVTATITDCSYLSSIHKWQARFNAEVHDIVEEIVVELELGGDKNRLMKLLSEI